MKALFTVVVILGLAFPGLARAMDLPKEAAAVLVSKPFTEVVDRLRTEAEQSGRLIRISSIGVTRTGEKSWVALAVEEKLAAVAGGAFEPKGEIDAVVGLDPLGNFVVEGAYFKPLAEPPPAGGFIN